MHCNNTQGMTEAFGDVFNSTEKPVVKYKEQNIGQISLVYTNPYNFVQECIIKESFRPTLKNVSSPCQWTLGGLKLAFQPQMLNSYTNNNKITWTV